MKAIVLGASLTGKTTLLNYLKRDNTSHVSEIDDVILEKNKGIWPTDDEFKLRVLTPPIVREVFSKENIIFLTNTHYFSISDIEHARSKGFLIIQLTVPLDELKRRNEKRVKEEEYEDMTKYFESMLSYQKQVFDAGLVDLVIDGTQPTDQIAERILSFINEAGPHRS